MNKKQLGEIGERITIGELAKYGIDVMLPLTDNLPFDLVVFHNNKFFKCQVKTSNKTEDSTVIFNITSNNWYSKTTHFYTNSEVDVWILCDCKNIYLMRYDENSCRNMITLRVDKPKNNQSKGVKYLSDYIISAQRIEEVFS